MMQGAFLRIGAAFGLIGVAAGAFGAHALRGRLTPADLAIFETAVRYQMIHALALLAVGIAAARWPERGWTLAAWAFTAGVLVFSGTLYLLALTGIGWLGAITPIGGLCLMAGWALVIRAAGSAR